MSEKKFKRVGWTVETRAEKNLPWIFYTYAIGLWKKDAIHGFEFVNDHLKYKRLKQQDLAHCVPLYVEVSHD